MKAKHKKPPSFAKQCRTAIAKLEKRARKEQWSRARLRVELGLLQRKLCERDRARRWTFSRSLRAVFVDQKVPMRKHARVALPCFAQMDFGFA
jgi:hypothetical protein